LDFKTTEQDESIEVDDVYAVERSISVKADVKDYLNIYRSLDAKYNQRDLSNYSSFSFYGKGDGDVEITIVKESISEWSEQFRTRIKLNDENTVYNLDYGVFVSSQYDQIDLSDVTMIVFTVLGDNLNKELKQVELSNLQFNNRVISSVFDSEVDDQFKLYPNPIGDSETLLIELNRELDGQLRITNQYGQEVYVYKISNKDKKIKVDCDAWSQGVYMCQLTKKGKMIKSIKFLKFN